MGVCGGEFTEGAWARFKSSSPAAPPNYLGTYALSAEVHSGDLKQVMYATPDGIATVTLPSRKVVFYPQMSPQEVELCMLGNVKVAVDDDAWIAFNVLCFVAKQFASVSTDARSVSSERGHTSR